MSEPKLPKPFLKKGQGTARFFRPPASRYCPPSKKSEDQDQQGSTDNQQLPRFTPTISSIPQSARTDFDSGISNEGGSPFCEQDDDTRPPTMTSLTLDSPSAEGRSSLEPHQNRQISVLEENDLENFDDQNNDKNNDIESVSVLEPVNDLMANPTQPSFVNDLISPTSTGTSKVSTNCSALTEEGKAHRKIAIDCYNRANNIELLDSVSQGTSSTMSTPLGASTPIDKGVGTKSNTQQKSYEDWFATPKVVSNNRPFASNRINSMAQTAQKEDEAQTGISLIQGRGEKNNGNLLQKAIAQDHRQKENREFPPRPNDKKSKKLNESSIQNNLLIQLRNAIAHVDYAEVQLRKRLRDVEKMKQNFELKEKELTEKFRQKFETLEEEQRAANEQTQRDRRYIERDRKMLQKNEGEKVKEQLKLINELREKLSEKEKKMASLRLEKRSAEEKLKKKSEEFEKQAKECERQKKNNLLMEKRLNFLKNEIEKKKKEEEMFAKAAMKNGNFNNGAAYFKPLPTADTLKPALKEGKNVKWADSDEIREISIGGNDECVNVPHEWMMTPIGKAMNKWGPCVVYQNSAGIKTCETTTIENGKLYDYADNSQRWINLQETVEIEVTSPPTSVIQIYLLQSNICLRFFKNRQLEIIRPNDMISLVSYQRHHIRTEIVKKNDFFHTELFDRDGRVTHRNLVHQDVFKEYVPGEKYSFRDDESRYVHVTTFDDFEYIEPEFRLRWYKGDQIVCKIFLKKFDNSNDLRLEILPKTNELKVESIQGFSPINRVSQKKVVWMSTNQQIVN